MSRLKKISRWLICGAGVLFIILAGILFVVPRLVNLDSVKEKIIAEVSQKIGGDVSFREIKLAFLPLPHVSIYSGSLSIPKTVHGSIEYLSVYPKIVPLFSGNIRIHKLTVGRPEFNVIIPARKKKADQASSAMDLEEKIRAVLGLIASIGENSDLSLRNGQLNLRIENVMDLTFQDIDSTITVPENRIRFNFKSGSNVCKHIAIKAEIDLKSLKSRGQIELSQLRPQQLAAHMISPDIINIGESQLSLNFKFNADRFNDLRGELQGTLPRVVLYKGKEKVVIKSKGFKGTFHTKKDRIELALTELKLDRPQATLSGRFIADRIIPKFAVEIKAKDVDVHSVRQNVLAMAGDIPVVNAIFDILKGGRVPAIRFASSGKSMSALAEFERMSIKGSLLEGDVLVPAVDFKVADASGEASIARGLLHVRNIKAVYDTTRVTDGTLRLGFSGKDAPFDLNIGLDADLGQVPDVLKTFIGDKNVITGLNRISDLNGRAEVRLILGEKLNTIRTRVKVAKFNLDARIDSLPSPLGLKGKDLSYEGTVLNVQELNGRFKNSNFSVESVGLDWGKTDSVQIDSGNADIDLDEIYTLLLSREGVGDKLTFLKSLEGMARISAFVLRGPLSKPANVKFKANGSVSRIKLDSGRLPATLFVNSGRFEMAHDILSFSELDIKTMDAALKVSGRLNGYLKGVRRLELNLQGKAGEQADLWLLKQINLPSSLLIRPPLHIPKARLTWDRSGRTTITGDLNIRRDLNISVDVQLEPDIINIKNFVIWDEISRAAFALNLQKKKINLRFNGNLQKSTVDKFLKDNQVFNGWIKGDLQLSYFQERPMNSVFKGNLTAKDIVLLKQLETPINVKRISIDGEKNKFLIASDVVFQKDRHLKLKGSVDYSPKEIFFDGDIASNGIVLDRLVEKLHKTDKGKTESQKEKKAKVREKLWNFPLHGTVRIDSDYLQYKKYKWSPFRADISLHPERINMSVIHADLCGISMPGMVNITPREIQLEFSPFAQNKDFQTAAACLLDQTTKVTGSFNFAGEITGRGAAKDLLNSLEGNFKLNTGEGRILAGRSYRTLRNILAIVNITEIYKGKLPPLTKEGFGYNSIKTSGRFKNNTLVFEEGLIDGFTMNVAAHGEVKLAEKQISLQVLVAPLKTVDAIISKIPLVGYLLGRSLISIAVNVKGDLDNPNVTLLPPSAVGEGLVGIMKRTLQLPVKIIKPIVPKEKQQEAVDAVR